jgi:hypothetical protein
MIARIALASLLLGSIAFGAWIDPHRNAIAQQPEAMPLFINEVNGWCEQDGGCGGVISDAGNGYWRVLIADIHKTGRSGCVEMVIPEWVDGYAYMITGIFSEPVPVDGLASMQSAGRHPVVCELVIRRHQ